MASKTAQEWITTYKNYEDQRQKALQEATKAFRAANPNQPSRVSDLKNYGYDSDAWITYGSELRKQITDDGYIISNNTIMTREEQTRMLFGDDYIKQANKYASDRTAAKKKEAEEKAKPKPKLTEEEKRVKKFMQQREREAARKKAQADYDQEVDNTKKKLEEEIADHNKAAKQKTEDQKKAKEEKEAEYEKQREELKKKRDEAAAKEAEARHKLRTETVEKQKEQARKDADASVANAQKYINDHMATGTYTGTSKQALQDLKDTAKGIFNTTFDGLKKEMQGSLSSNDMGSIGKTKELIDALMNGANNSIDVKSKIQQLQAGGLSAEQIAVISAQMNLNMQKEILCGGLAEQVVLDGISDQIYNLRSQISAIGNSAMDAYLIQRAYINAYLSETFGNPEFMASIHTVVNQKVDIFLDTFTAEQLKNLNTELDKKIDNTFTRVNKKIDNTTKKINIKLDVITKGNLIETLNDKISKTTSMSSLINKMNKNPVLKLFTPIVSSVASAASTIIMSKFTSKKGIAFLARLQVKAMHLQKTITKAQEFIKKKTEMLKNYVNEMKQKAMAAIQTYANKIVGDIKSKIAVATGKALGL